MISRTAECECSANRRKRMTLDANAKERKDLPFEEEFPSLKDWTNLPMVLEVNKAIFYPCTVLKEHCLDKQRVKEAIDKSTFIEHLTDKQQKELFDIVVGK